MHGFGFGPSRRRLAAAPPALALKTGFVHRVDPAAQGTSTNGAAINTIVDSVAAGQMAKLSSAAATYVANAANGQPGIRFGASGVFNAYNVDRTTNAGLVTAIGTREYTSHIAFTGLAGTDIGVFLNWNTTNNSKLVIAPYLNGVGIDDPSGASICRIKLTDSGVHVLSIAVTLGSVTGQSSAGRTLVYMDGLPVGELNNAPSATFGTTPRLGALLADGTYGCRLTLLDWVTYASFLTPIDIWKNTAFFFNKFGKAMASKIVLVDGPSLVAGVGADDAQYNVVASLIAQLGIPYGSIGNFGIGGISFTGMNAKAPAELDPFIAHLGAANVLLVAWEGYNELATNSAGVAVGNAVTYLNNRIAAGFLPANIRFGTITGVSSARTGSANYPAYAAGVATIPANNPATLGDVTILRFDQDAGNHIGVQGTAGGYYDAVYGNGDGVHLSGKAGYVIGDTGVHSGYPYLADMFLRAPVAAWLAS